MKALLVGDNGSGSNWGGRGVSTALHALFGTHFHALDSVFGSEFSLEGAGFGYVGTVLPRPGAWIFNHMVTHRRRRRLFDVVVRAQEALGAKDFVTEDPAQTAANVLRYRQSHAGIGHLYDRVAAADLVLVNGEGDIVFTTPPRREVLMMMGIMELALRLGKRVALINSMLSDCPETGRNQATAASLSSLLERCVLVAVRDEQSLTFLRENCPRASACMVPDALFEFGRRLAHYRDALPPSLDMLVPFPDDGGTRGIDLRKPYVCVGGGASAALDPRRAVSSYLRLLESLRSLGLEIILIESDGRDGFLRQVAATVDAAILPVRTSIHAAAAVLAGARAFISGRYHPSILASLGGTPCVFLGSTAHKMSSVQSILGYEVVRQYPSFPEESHCKQIVALVGEYLAQGAALRAHLEAVARRRTEALGALVDRVLNTTAGAAAQPALNVV